MAMRLLAAPISRYDEAAEHCPRLECADGPNVRAECRLRQFEEAGCREFGRFARSRKV
jgi:hypothetical protein